MNCRPCKCPTCKGFAEKISRRNYLFCTQQGRL
ncbi:MAG: (Fe-S)-binding protein [Sediminibacterium sp.]